MKPWIALLRGINVGGKHVLPMKNLVSLLEDLHCQNVMTYIQSGNVVFKSEERDDTQLSGRIRDEINRRCGFEPAILLLQLQDMEQIIEENPFPQAESTPQTLHVGFLASPPINPDLKKLEELKRDTEQFHLTNSAFYLCAPDGIGRSRLASQAERLLGVPMTDRNWRTICKIMEMAALL